VLKMVGDGGFSYAEGGMAGVDFWYEHVSGSDDGGAVGSAVGSGRSPFLSS